MNIGIGLPSTVPGVRASTIIDWAKQAEAGPFSSLGTIDRIVYPGFEPLATLAAVAAVTQRIRLMTTVLLAPLRNAGILAKQAASIDALSGGRLILGVGIGGRVDDFLAAPAQFEGRGRHLEEQLAVMKRIWSGQSPVDDVGAVGPPPAQQGGPEILIGSYAPAGIARVGRWADGFISGGVDAATASQFYSMAEDSWRAAGRQGKPRLVGAAYYALGPNAAEGAQRYIVDYYGYMGPVAEQMANAVPSSPDAVRAAIQSFADAGTDELMLWPCIAELDQVSQLADLVE
jgi:alkanesulfonate monooxygenase SsuD/methylene tetrahydromethanopterin reductase-like flavin-dependent oxidoreductase (luciferase family)